ncbi:MAG: ArsC/Spx/MgsR family protein [Vigna little leaf phytoplasma]|nr:ArsC/Spx/MgsR family protein [Vigna little leaf phytoplasma]
MVFIYTRNRCASCLKAKKWFKLHRIQYKEKNLNISKLTESNINTILSYEGIDFTSFISTRCSILKKYKDFFCLSVKQVKKFIIQNSHKICKTPIIYNDKNILIGYNNEDIRIFIPKHLRSYIIKNSINHKSSNYLEMINKYFENF